MYHKKVTRCDVLWCMQSQVRSNRLWQLKEKHFSSSMHSSLERRKLQDNERLTIPCLDYGLHPSKKCHSSYRLRGIPPTSFNYNVRAAARDAAGYVHPNIPKASMLQPSMSPLPPAMCMMNVAQLPNHAQYKAEYYHPSFTQANMPTFSRPLPSVSPLPFTQQ